MKALVYTGTQQVEYREEPDPRLGTGEVLLRIDAVGICGSDMHAYHGHDPRRVPPLILGHEFAGEIVEGPAKGTRVTANPLIACGRCDNCLQGRGNLCSDRTMVGMTRPGALAQFMTIPTSTLIELPASLSPVQAALTEPAATALHAVNAAIRASHRPLPESSALVLGGGAVGLLTALLLHSYGVREIHLAETNPLRRDSAAKACSSARVFDPATGKGPAENGVNVVFDAVGAARTRALALSSVAPGGTVVHVGLQDWASEIDMRKLTLAEITLIGTYTYTTADMRTAVRAIADGALGDLAWVQVRPLARGAEAFADLHHGRSAAAKIVLRPD
jgi:alcohol dehydrogenase